MAENIPYRLCVLLSCIFIAVIPVTAESADSDYYLEAAMVNAGGVLVFNGFPVILKSERGGSETVSTWCTPLLINGENTVGIRFEPTSDENEISKLDFKIISHPHGIPRNPPENEETIISRKFDSHEFAAGPVVFTPLPEQHRYYMNASGKLTVTRSDPVPSLSVTFRIGTGPGQHPLENVYIHLSGFFFEHVVYGPYTMSPGTGEQVIRLGPEKIADGSEWLLPDPEKPEPEFDKMMIQCDSSHGVTTKIASLKLNGTEFRTSDFSPFERRYWEWTNPRGFKSIPKWVILRSLTNDLLNVRVYLKKSPSQQVVFGDFFLYPHKNRVLLTEDRIVSGSGFVTESGFGSVRIEGDSYHQETKAGQAEFGGKYDWEETLTFDMSVPHTWAWQNADLIGDITDEDRDAVWNIIVSVRQALQNKNRESYRNLFATQIGDMARAMYTSEDDIAASLTGFIDSLGPGGGFPVPVSKADLRLRVYENGKVAKAETAAGENLVVSRPPDENDWNNTYDIPLHFSRFAGTWKIVSAVY